MTAQVSDLVGIGLYTKTEAARLLSIPRAKLQRWADGYCYNRGRRHVTSPAVIHRVLAERQALGLITFVDLVELGLVAAFREHGLSMQTIREAARVASGLFNTDHPFAVKQFSTDGRSIFAKLVDRGADSPPRTDGHVIEDLVARQYVFPNMTAPFLRRIEWGEKEAARLWPMGKEGRIVIDPKRNYGKPIDESTGVAVGAICAALETGEEPPVVAGWFEVPVAAVVAALEFQEALGAA